MKKRMAKVSRAKPVSYVLIPPHSEVGSPMYERLWLLIDEHHKELADANVRIALAWATSWKADVDGRLVLGKCKKASDLDRELAPYDFVILLNRDFWLNPRVEDVQRQALLDHELMHAAIAYDEHGEPKVDERGRTVFRIRKHDLEEFSEIAARYGCWKRDIESFAQALHRAEHGPRGFVGPTTLSGLLADVGLDVPPATIATWPDEERRDVLVWVRLRIAAGVTKVNAALSETLPACLAAVVRAEDAGGEARQVAH